MLIQSSSSSSCRGWEDNSSDIEETDHTSLHEYLIEMVMDDYEVSREESIEELEGDPDGWGGWEKINDDEYNYEGEEVTVTYSVFVPTQNFVDMLQRNVK